ncbi:MAG: redoxin domain-containing protein [Chloroflexi bacterium]|nr:redoxin domain-containing protein [Chloroflexota bacterium]
MSPELQAGRQAPDFTAASASGDLRLADLLKKGKLLLAFYTEDATPLCSSEVASFKEEFATFQELGAQVVAISSDGLDSHKAFAQKLGGLPFPLASDPSLGIASQYGVADPATERARRAVFVIDQNGVVLHANSFYNPGNPGHFAEIFKALGLEM